MFVGRVGVILSGLETMDVHRLGAAAEGAAGLADEAAGEGIGRQGARKSASLPRLGELADDNKGFGTRLSIRRIS